MVILLQYPDTDYSQEIIYLTIKLILVYISNLHDMRERWSLSIHVHLSSTL